MFDCKEVVEMLGDYLENDVAVDLRADLEAHLAQCHTCRVILDSTRKTIRIVTDSRSFDVPEDLSDRMIAKIMSQIPRGPGDKPPSGTGGGSPSGTAG